MKVKFSKPGDYNVVANFSLDCIDWERQSAETRVQRRARPRST